MKCNKCGSEQPANTVTNYCTVCGSLMGATDEIIADLPWEKSEDLGLFKAFIETTKLVLTKPSIFFRNLTEKTSLFSALMYALLASAIGSLADVVWHTLFLNSSLISSFQIPDIASKTVALTPLILLFHLLFMSLYIFILLTITGVRKRSLRSIFSGVCYTHAASVLTIVPFLGTLAMPIWSIVITVIMMSRMNKISILRSTLTLFLPALILFTIFVIPLMIFMGGILFSIGSILKYYK